MNPLHVPDISEFQPNVNWTRLVEWNGGAALVRAHNGYRPDKAWYNGARRTEAHRAGVKALGLYLYLVHDRDPAVQVHELATLLGGLHPGEFVMIDLEEGAGNQDHRAADALHAADQMLGYTGYNGAWLYSGASFALNHGLAPLYESPRHTLVAAYQDTEPSDPRLAHTLWQHTDGHFGARHPIPGVDTTGPDFTDCSIFHGDVTKLRSRICSG